MNEQERERASEANNGMNTEMGDEATKRQQQHLVSVQLVSWFLVVSIVFVTRCTTFISSELWRQDPISGGGDEDDHYDYCYLVPHSPSAAVNSSGPLTTSC